MKKKGLIISTVVMVVVLIASLTTATYAWFTTSNKTTISGFNVSVVSSNAVNIAMKKQYGFADTISPADFTTGDVEFQTAAQSETGGPGSITNPGSWSNGSDGFSATLNHNINWGSQSKAVGSTKAADVNNDVTKATAANTEFWVNGTAASGSGYNYDGTTNGKTAVIAANKVAGSSDLTNQSLAYANINGEGAGDYVHFILGVQPTKALGRNNFVISITPSNTTDSLGVLASIHVAYRVKKEGTQATAWTEKDVYGDYHGTTKKANVSTNVTGTLETAYKDAAGVTSVPAGTMACVIDGLDTQMNKVTQIEVVIYMAGADSDCNDQGKTSSGDIMMFFDSANEQTKATSAKLTAEGKLEIEGGDEAYSATNTTVKIGDQLIAGTWTSGKFTSTDTVEATGGTTKVVVQTQGKEAKELTIQPAA